MYVLFLRGSSTFPKRNETEHGENTMFIAQCVFKMLAEALLVKKEKSLDLLEDEGQGFQQQLQSLFLQR